VCVARVSDTLHFGIDPRFDLAIQLRRISSR
jgi:hypothetical protein